MLLRRKPTLTKIVRQAGFYFNHRDVDAFIDRDLIAFDGDRSLHSKVRVEDGVHLLQISNSRYWITIEKRKIVHVTRVSRLGQ